MSSMKKIVRVLLVINVMQLIAGVIAYLYLIKTLQQPFEWQGLLILGGMLLTSLILLVGLYIAWKSNDNKYEETVQQLEELNRTLRAQRHDYLNHFQVVYGLMQLEEYEEARAYLAPVFREITKVGKVLKTSQPAVNALLQAKLQTAEEAGIEVMLEIRSDLKALPIEAWSLCKVLANLIDNAIRALTEDQSSDREKQLKITIWEENSSYFFTVANNGPMIAEELQKTIFQPGVTTRREKGHGMGLYIVNKILQEAGGSIRLTSTPELTVFDVMLPTI